MLQPKKLIKIQIIGIWEEIDSFYWPKMRLWKGDKKFGQGPPPPPRLHKIQKNSNFSFVKPALTTKISGNNWEYPGTLPVWPWSYC